MRAGAQRNDRLPGKVGIHEVLHLVVRPFAKTKQHHDGVGGIKGLRPRHIRLNVRIDRMIRRINREQDRAFEAVAFGQDYCKLRQALFRPVFFVAGEEDDMFAGAGPGFPHDKPQNPLLKREC